MAKKRNDGTSMHGSNSSEEAMLAEIKSAETYLVDRGFKVTGKSWYTNPQYSYNEDTPFEEGEIIGYTYSWSVNGLKD